MSKSKQEAPKEPITKTFYSIQPKNGAYTIVTMVFDVANEKVVSVDESVEDIFNITMKQFERKVRVEYGI